MPAQAGRSTPVWQLPELSFLGLQQPGLRHVQTAVLVLPLVKRRGAQVVLAA
jgi:hypothetical protein